jgi:hypothetical protein
VASVQVISAMAFDVDTWDNEDRADPVIKVLGELPGVSRPFHVNRVYKGAQGRYEETVLLVDPDKVVIWESNPRFIELRGEMFEDLFRTQVDDHIPIASLGEHTIVFLLEGREAGRIPVFIEAPESLTAAGVAGDAAEEALKKGFIMWLDIPQQDGTTIQRAAWYVQQGRKLFVLKGGPGEQQLPNLEECDVVSMTVKARDQSAAIATMQADVRVVAADSDEFESIATLGLGKRLNLSDGEDALQRWKDTCTMVELTPRG